MVTKVEPNKLSVFHGWLEVNKTEENVSFVYISVTGICSFFFGQGLCTFTFYHRVIFPFKGSHASWIMLKEDDTFAKVR